MNSFEANKIFGAVLGTIFVLFGGSILAEGLFHAEAPEEPGFEIEVAESDGGGEAEAPAEDPPIAALMQDASAEDGAATFRQCQACHSGEEGGPNKVGPHLWNVVDRPIAHVSDFSYSSAMTEFSEDGSVNWDYEHLYHFLKNPQGYISGTAMGFAGISDPEDRADIIAYLRSLSDEPAPLPEPPAEGSGEGEGGGEGGGEQSASAEDQGGGEGGDTAQQEESPSASTAPGSQSGNSGNQAAGVQDTQASQPAAGAEEAPTMSDSEQPDPPATDQPQGDQQGGTSTEGAAGDSAGGQAQTGSQSGEGSQNANANASGEGGEQAASGEQSGGSGGEEGGTQTASISGDPEAGESIFNQCQACHAVGEGAQNKIGPELNGIVGEEIAAVEGYSFSSGLQDYAAEHGEWTVEELTAWLKNPRDVVANTKMAFPGLSSDEDVQNVIAYLASFNEDGTRSQGQ